MQVLRILNICRRKKTVAQEWEMRYNQKYGKQLEVAAKKEEKQEMQIEVGGKPWHLLL